MSLCVFLELNNLNMPKACTMYVTLVTSSRQGNLGAAWKSSWCLNIPERGDLCRQDVALCKWEQVYGPSHCADVTVSMRT